MNRSLLASMLLLAITLAGCSEDPAPKAAEDEDFSELDLDVADGKGLIRGVIVDEAVSPVAGATVTLSPGGAEATTTEAGLFGFTDLEPGTYFLDAGKIGYFPAQQSVDVVANEPAPPVVRIRIVEDLSGLPRAVTFEDTGFIACGWGVPITYGYCGDTTGGEDDYRLKYTIDGDPDWIQAEIVWKSTQATENLYIINAVCPPEYFDNCPGTISESFRWDEGAVASPAIMRTWDTFMDEAKADFGKESMDGWAIGVDVSADTVAATGVTIDQKFTGYVTMFWNIEPDADWTFNEDGAYPVPS